MSVYLPEKTYVVCTHHSGGGYRQLEVNKDLREQTSVILKSKDHPFLVITDKKIDSDFACKTQWNSVVSYAAFTGAGAAGILTGAIAVGLLVPGPGWVFSAICIGVVAGAAIIGGIVGYFMNKTKCSERLGTPNSVWILAHPTVYFDGYQALNKKSILQCQEGGTLLPFISESAASDAASAIGWWNKAEIGLNGVASAFDGYELGLLLFTGGPGAVALQFAITYALGQYVINPLTEVQSDYIQSESEWGDAETYKNINNDKLIEETIKSNEENYGYEKTEKEEKFWTPGDLENPISINHEGKPAGDLTDIYTNSRDGYQNNESRRVFNQAQQNAQDGISNSAENNPRLHQQMNRHRDLYSNRSGNRRGTNNPTRHANSSREMRTRMRANGKGIAKGVFTLSANFVANWFNEMAREVASKYAMEDVTNSISVNAKDN